MSSFARLFRYQGATLFVVTLLGVSAIQVTQMQEKMSSNLQDKEVSFNAAETALRQAENWILSQSTQPPVVAKCSTFPCVQTVLQKVILEDKSKSWWRNNSAEYSGTLANVATPPRYIIEHLQYIPDSLVIGVNTTKSAGVHYYHVTARGTGATDDSISIIQTTVGRRY